MKNRIFSLTLLIIIASCYCVAQDKKNALPDLQTAESIFFNPADKQENAYQFTTPWRLEVGYVQFNHRTQDTSALYLHGIRLGATVDFVLPYHFSIQTGALIQLQLTIPVRAYYTITLWRKLRMFFFAGPQLQIGLTNYHLIDNQISIPAMQWVEKQGIKTTNYDQYIDKQLYRTNIQFGLGGGFEWDRYRLQAGYDFGLNNILRANASLNHKMNEWGWMCTFSYRL